jgi:hypothetical protein
VLGKDGGSVLLGKFVVCLRFKIERFVDGGSAQLIGVILELINMQLGFGDIITEDKEKFETI